MVWSMEVSLRPLGNAFYAHIKCYNNNNGVFISDEALTLRYGIFLRAILVMQSFSAAELDGLVK